MKKAVCSGYYGFNNFGDDAVLKVLVENLRYKYNLTILSSNPKETSLLYNVNSVQSFDYLKVLNEIITSDIFISGGGSLLQDITSFKSLLYYVLLIYWALFFKKDVIIFAQGLGTFKRKISRFMVKNALKHCKIITVRDQKSYKFLSDLNIKAELVCDPVFNLTCPNLPKTNNAGIQLRSFKGLDEKFLKDLAAAVNFHFKENNVVIYALQPSIDLEICKNFAALLDVKNVEIKSNLSLENVITELSSLQYLIAMRFHASLIGLKAGVKVLPIAYDEKVEQLAQKAGVEFIEMTDSDRFYEKIDRLKKLETSYIEEKLAKEYLDFRIFDI